jgi:hypothetical protein
MFGFGVHIAVTSTTSRDARISRHEPTVERRRDPRVGGADASG